VVVDRRTGRLMRKTSVPRTFSFSLDENFTITEFFQVGLAQGNIQVGGDFFRQLPVGISGKNLKISYHRILD
jgi:hypothetical protein